MFGFLNIQKPVGMTSHDVVACLRRVTKIKQIGHSGTLDPFAEGVLPIAIGKATRLIEFLNDDKTYRATVQFGKNTSTYDVEGEVTKSFDKKITESELSAVLKTFAGEQEQMPPMYSAIKVNGKKLYEYARNNEKIEIKSRKIFINKIELKSFDEENQCAEILVDCSKGTYIRSIAYDIGQKLNCGGYLSKLVRTRVGKFELKNSIKLADCESIETIEQNLLNPLEMVELPQFEISEDEYQKVLQGQFFQNSKISCSDFCILVYNNSVIAVAVTEESLVKVKKVFR